MMSKERDSSSDGGHGGGESSPGKLQQHISEENKIISDERAGFSEKGVDFLRDSEMACDVSPSKAPRTGNSSGSQELTLRYLCDNSKLGFPEKEAPGKNLLYSVEKVTSYKGKEVVSDDQKQDDGDRWVERDFMQLNDKRGISSKRDVEDDETERENREEKKQKLEALNLSLALPDVSLSLAAPNPVQSNDLPSRLMPSRSIQSLAPSNTYTQTTYSNDFTAASKSYSYSHPFSHNPSCSLTRNSTENYEYSVGNHRRECDQIWNCGEGTNGSVHSRFRPIGDGITLANHVGGSLGSIQGKDNNSLYRTTSSDNVSFFPSELPARPRIDALSSDSKGRGSEQQLRVVENSEPGKVRNVSRPERILREIVSESIPLMAQIIQEFTDETMESTKEYLKNLIVTPEKKEEFVSLQNRLDRRSDLTTETLLKCNKNQLEMIVAIKMGLGSFVTGKNHLPTNELVEIFLLERCRNVNCRRALPVDDCDCKICVKKKGFCSECMCPVCFNFDCANNTCTWVGCDICGHWCHATCGIQRNLIKPSPSLKGPPGNSEMQFHCLGCDHASEMYGFVKDVFKSCAKGWSLETLMKELACVKEIFRRSEDVKGKELHIKANEILSKLEKNTIPPSDACTSIFKFFSCTDGMSEYPVSSVTSKELTQNQASLRQDTTAIQAADLHPPKPSFYNTTSSGGKQDSLTYYNLHQNDVKATNCTNDKLIEDEWSVKLTKKHGFDSLESIVRIKEAESRMFQSRADEARREAEGYRRMVRLKSDKLEEDYAEKLGRLCLQETEERRRKKLEELKVLENSHCDYQKMKLRMQAEIAGLLERMEMTKQQWV